MRKGTKILIIIAVWFVGMLIMMALGEATETKRGGGLGIAVMFGVFAATAAIWKWKPESERNNENKLDKK
jgi:hypothetical protein